MTTSNTSSELTLLGARLRVMTIARMATVAALLLALAPVFRYAEGSSREVLVSSSIAYMALNALVFVMLKRLPSSTRWLLDLSLVGDAAWATSVLFVTGQTTSGFIFLMYLQLVAGTVLFSWRTGLKLAILHTLGLTLNFYAQAGGFSGGDGAPELQFGLFNLDLDPGLEETTAQFVRVQFVLSIVTVWVMTGATAFFSQVNERALVRSNQELAVLRQLSSQLERTLELGQVCQAIAQGVVQELRYHRAIVWMAQGGNDLVPAGAEGFDPDELDAISTMHLSVAPGPVARAVEARKAVLVAREHARPATLADAFAIDSPLVIVPLQTEGRILGLLTVEIHTPMGRAPKIRNRDLRILETLSTEASLALDNARLHAELHDLAITDALTGVYNHRHFQQRLQEELDRSARLGTVQQPRPLSLVIMDVDLFKRINDRFGHQAGDDLLRALARLMQRVLRSSDVVCRYGGEEFTVILPETTAAQAMQVAERLREAIERSSFTGSDGRYLGQVTASFGVATYSRGVPSRSELIRLADESLYEAKGSGRNRVVHAEELSLAFVEEAHLGANRTVDGDDGSRRPDDRDRDRDGRQGTTFASDRERAPDGDGDAPEPAVAALDAGGPSVP